MEGKRSSSLKSIEFSDGGFHLMLLYRRIASTRALRRSLQALCLHVVICTGRIWRLCARKDQAVIPVLQARQVLQEDRLDAIGELHRLELYSMTWIALGQWIAHGGAILESATHSKGISWTMCGYSSRPA